MAADNRHFHHTLLRLGLNQSQSVTTIYFFAVLVGLIGLTPVVFSRYGFSWVPYVAGVALAAALPASMRLNQSVIHHIQARRQKLGSFRIFGSRIQVILRWLEQSTRYCIYIIFLGIPLLAGSISREVGYAAWGAVFLLGLSRILQTRVGDFLYSIAFSLAAIVMLIANNQNTILVQLQGKVVNIQVLYNALFLWLAVASTFVFLGTFRRRYLLFTASDFLMLVLPLILLLAPAPLRATYLLDIIALRSIILFVSTNFLVRHRMVTLNKIRFVMFMSLLLIGFIGTLSMRLVYKQ